MKFFKTRLFKMLLGMVIGVILGLFINETIMSVIVACQRVLSQLINFLMPIVVFTLIAASIAELGSKAGKIFAASLGLMYGFGVIAALIGSVAGYGVSKLINIGEIAEKTKVAPEPIFTINIPQIMTAFAALILAALIGFAINWTKADKVNAAFQELKKMLMEVVKRVIIPLLPFYIGNTFCKLSYEGTLTKQMPSFALAIVSSILCQFVLIGIFYLIAWVATKNNVWKLFRNVLPAYFTALATSSSVATMPTAIDCLHKTDFMDKKITEFSIPLFMSINYSASILTICVYVIVAMKIFQGTVPGYVNMLAFSLLLPIFSTGAAGVTGGTVMASLGMMKELLGLGDAGASMMFGVFTLQDCFNTSSNFLCNSAIISILSNYAKKHSVDVGESK